MFASIVINKRTNAQVRRSSRVKVLKVGLAKIENHKNSNISLIDATVNVERENNYKFYSFPNFVLCRFAEFLKRLNLRGTEFVSADIF
ncbi:hypothetical protein BpHYR1_030359 [Brachionus plicatilis]|uniref:Uncharacterized protein n=1 Tax=Brachionus plicatilis TaxID=10195 RepID=A0A3M7RCH8_BRAPC|nr:hypothetical protein BpHYR1_030359 [Brachionus plicatilis]